jgi:hypothetical protein
MLPSSKGLLKENAFKLVFNRFDPFISLVPPVVFNTTGIPIREVRKSRLCRGML